MKELKKVEIVCIDMWETYRIIAKTYFPNAKIVIDKFHIIQEAGRILTKARIHAMNNYKNPSNFDRKSATSEAIERYDRNSRIYYVFKKFQWLLLKTSKHITDPNNEKKFNRKLNRYLNYYDLLQMILDHDKDLNEVYNFYHRLHRFYRKNIPKNTSHKEMLETLIDDIAQSNIETLVTFSDTLIRWKQEILNTFIDPKSINSELKHTDRFSNAIIEKKTNQSRL